MGSNKAAKRNQKQQAIAEAARREQIAALYLEGYTQADIATQLGVSQPTISRELAVIRQQWVERALFDFNQAKRRELAVLDRIEAEAWEAFRASQEPRVITQSSGKKGGPVLSANKQIEERNGDPRFLTIVLNCVEKRMKLLGLETPTKHEHTGTDGGPIRIARELTDDELAAIASGRG